MRAGQLDRRVTLEFRTVTYSDSGEEVVTWDELATVWGHKVEAKGAERFANQQLVGQAVTTFQIRWSSAASDLTTMHRIVFDGRTYDIVDVREIGRREGIEFDCTVPSEEPVA